MPLQADRLSASGVALATPLARFVGTLAVPFANSWKACSGETVVPPGEPDSVRLPSRPLPPQRTTSSAWHAAARKSMSAWQSAKQLVAFARRQLYGVVMTPPDTTTVCIAALCTY